MKLKYILLTLSVLASLATSVNASEDGEKLFEAKCAMCHTSTRPSDMSKMVAPPAMGVMRHVKMKYTTKEDAIAFITEYALNPQRSKAVCMPQKIKRFGLMPSQKGNVSKAELQTIAAWMYENFPSTKGWQGKMNQKEGSACKAKGSMGGMKCQAGKCQSGK